MADSGRLDELQRKFEENPRRYFAPLANEYRKSGDAERAIELCRTYLPHLPGHMSGYIVYGQSLFDANRGEESARVFQEALRIDPENVIALRHLGDIARIYGDRSAAIQWYQQLLDLDPKNEEISAYIDELIVAGAETPSPVQQHYAPYEYTTEHASLTSVEEIVSEPASQLESQSVSDLISEDLAAESESWAALEAEPSFESNALESEFSAEPDLEPEFAADSTLEPETSVPFVTETLANLYIDQGLYNEALTVYRQLAMTRDDAAIHARVQELESIIAFQAAPITPPPVISAEAGREFRTQPAITVREFFAKIGARRIPPEPGEMSAHTLSNVFPTIRVNESDLRAARSLADAYAYGNPGAMNAPISSGSSGSYIRHI